LSYQPTFIITSKNNIIEVAMAQNFTDAVNQALQTAFNEAQKRQNTEVSDNHLLYAFLEDPEGYFYSFLSHLNTRPETLLEEVRKNLERQPTYSSPSPQPPGTSRSLQSRIADAQNIAQQWNDSYTSTTFFYLIGKIATNPFLLGKSNQELL
jgi:ATP-dependent Clp protease ATP-binding subunit ClpB